MMEHTMIDVFVGVDMAKTDHYAHAVTRTGETLFTRSVANDEGAINEMIDDVTAHGAAALVVDMTASGAQLLLTVAHRRQIPVAYVTGLQMRRAAQVYAGAAKTDPRDAFILADHAMRHADQLVWLDVTDDLLTRLRILNGRDIDLAADSTRTINRIRDALVAVSPALERAVGEHLSKAGVRDLLSKWPTPALLDAAGQTRIATMVGKRSPRSATKITDAVMTALEAQTVTLPGEPTWGEVIADLVGDLERVTRRRDGLRDEIEEVFLKHPLGQVLVTLCGFGPRTGARTLAEIGDPNRFATASRLASYAGLAPVDRRSGTSINSSSKSRGGNHRLKNAMFIAAFVATRHDPDARDYYQRKRDEGKKHNAAVICVARRRCNIILAMLKTGTAYNPSHKTELAKAA